MRTVTRHRTSVAWEFPTALTPHAREAIAGLLECSFTDENEPREVMPLAHDVTLLVVPEPNRFRIVAHFDHQESELPPTQESWLTVWVGRAAKAAGLATPGAPTAILPGS